MLLHGVFAAIEARLGTSQQVRSAMCVRRPRSQPLLQGRVRGARANGPPVVSFLAAASSVSSLSLAPVLTQRAGGRAPAACVPVVRRWSALELRARPPRQHIGEILEALLVRALSISSCLWCSDHCLGDLVPAPAAMHHLS